MKSGKANKQNQLVQNLKSQLELTKHQTLELSTALQSLQTQNTTLHLQNKKLSLQLSTLRTQTDSLIDNQKFHISILDSRNKQILKEKSDVEIELDSLKAMHAVLARQFDQFRGEAEGLVAGLRRKNQEDFGVFQASQSRFNSAVAEYDRLVREICELKELRESEKESFKARLANIERQKIQSIDNIKKQMLTKACEMRNKALEIRKEQLQVTTRLTFLQNDQLIRELEYQSCKTEEILRRNSQLENQVKELKRAIEIHQGVEKELVKRNVGAKNVIASLALEVNAGKGKSKIQSKESDELRSTNEPKKKVQIKIEQENGRKESESLQKSTKEYQDIQILREYIKNLQKTNQQQANQLIQLKRRSQSLQEETKKLTAKLGVQNFDNVAILMLRFLEEVVRPLKSEQKDDRVEEQSFNLEVLRDVNVEQWSLENLEKIAKIILNQLRPHLTMKMLKVPYFQTCSQSKSKLLDYDSLKQNLNASKYLQALKRHKNKSLQTIKSRSITYILDSAPKTHKPSHHRKISSIRNIKEQTLEPVAKRFIKPHLLTRL